MDIFDNNGMDKQEIKQQFQKAKGSNRMIHEGKKRAPLWKNIIAFAGFFIALGVLAYLADNFIIPGIVQSRETLPAPNVIGKTVSEAAEILSADGLQFAISSKKSGKEQVVVRQTPRPGSIIKEGRTVYLTLNKTLPKVRMPKIIGKTLDRARPFLIRQKLYFGEITYDYSDSLGADTIISQSVPPYRLIPVETDINIVISKGSENQVVVPNLYLLSLEEAKETIEKAELQLGNVVYISEKTFLPNTVIVQNPSAGEIVPRYTTLVDLTITK